MTDEIILVGNPNVGKTTLFNTLTNSFEKASNWHGVTVAVKSKEIEFENKKLRVVDLPGLYSLKYNSPEEKIAVDYLKANKDKLIVNICDANNLMRNLMLSTELLNEGFNVVLALNMINENRDYDINKLSKEIGTIVIGVDARKKQSVFQMMKIFLNKKSQNSIKTVKNTLIYDNIKRNLYSNISYKHDKSYKTSDRIDRFILNKTFFIIFFLIAVFGAFYITFGPIGMLFSSIINGIFNKLFNILRKIILCVNISDIIKSLLIDGVITGVQSIVSFIPQIAILMMLINILEDIGFMSRVAFMLDGVLKKVGLSGKSFFSLIMGYGCTTSAVLTTRNIENKTLRKRTIFLLPFMSCSAKLPIYLVISSLFFDKYKYIYVFLLYCFSIFIAVIVACFNKKIFPLNNQVSIFEMPKYRFPNLGKIFKDIYFTVIEFLKKIGSLVLIFTVIVWFLQNFTIGFQFLDGKNFSYSILYKLSEIIAFLFKPLGFDSVGVVVALLLGVVAKEMIVVGLAMINGVSELGALSASLASSSSICFFSPASSMVFLVFVSIYSPCISAIFAIKNELGLRSAIYVFVVQFVLAYIISFFVGKFLIDYRYIIALSLFLILDILLFFMLKSKKKKRCWGNCNACRNL